MTFHTLQKSQQLYKSAPRIIWDEFQYAYFKRDDKVIILPYAEALNEDQAGRGEFICGAYEL